jgi:hypothetical protein
VLCILLRSLLLNWPIGKTLVFLNEVDEESCMSLQKGVGENDSVDEREKGVL